MNNTKTDKKNIHEYSTILVSILFLFFLQQLTILIESIYHQSLLNKQINFSIAGLLAFCSPLLLLIKSQRNIRQKNGTVLLFLLFQTISPHVGGLWKVALSSLSVLLFLFILLNILSGQFLKESSTSLAISIAIMISILLRTIGSTINIDIYGTSSILNWSLIIAAFYLLWSIREESVNRINEKIPDKKHSAIQLYLLIAGIFSAIALFYFFLATPGILSRWTGADYNTIIIMVTASVTLFILLKTKTEFINKLEKHHIILWNLFFCASLILSIEINTISTIEFPESNHVVVEDPNTVKDLIVYVMLLLSPVVILDFALFKSCLTGNSITRLALPSFFASMVFLLLILIMIFTNIWGYVGVIGRIFRNAFVVPILVASIGLLLPYLRIKVLLNGSEQIKPGTKIIVLTGLILFFGIAVTLHEKSFNETNQLSKKDYITVMTYNIQQGVDYYGNKAYRDQLDVIKKINPDILCLQESDIARVSGGNNDIVKYFQDRLNFYCYYGPKTITGTFGTAILSRFPIKNCRTIFTYSDKDEVGTSICTVIVNRDSILIVNNHPDGTDLAIKAHTEMLINLITENQNIIIAGDFNFTNSSPFYKQISSKLNDVWYQIYPDGIGEYNLKVANMRLRNKNIRSGKLLADNKLDMTEKIDHIFISGNLEVAETHYLRAPESASDHPAHWAVLKIKNK